MSRISLKQGIGIGVCRSFALLPMQKKKLPAAHWPKQGLQKCIPVWGHRVLRSFAGEFGAQLSSFDPGPPALGFCRSFALLPMQKKNYRQHTGPEQEKIGVAQKAMKTELMSTGIMDEWKCGQRVCKAGFRNSCKTVAWEGASTM